jgi:hypothetical protein
MTILLCTFVLLAVVSVLANAVWSDLTNKRDGAFLKWIIIWRDDGSPWWKRLLSASVAFGSSLALLWFLTFPVITAGKWAESWQSKTPPFDLNLPWKGAALAVCWMIVVGQLAFRVGYEAGRSTERNEPQHAA